MLKVGIVGCGKIADDHVSLLNGMPHSQLVGVCDREELMAKQLAERFRIPAYFTDVLTLLERVRPDVVHVTTPPQGHFELARLCLNAGAHVFVEKPFTVHAAEARELVGLATQVNRKISVHHDQQFTEGAIRARKLIADGFLGGAPVHVESYYGYELGHASYARAVLGDRGHWVRRLPGQLLHNVISHGISKIAELVPTDAPTVIAHGFPSRFVRSIGEPDIIDELRVIVSDGDAFTAYFTFSSQMRPNLHLVRIYGPKNGIEIDHDQRTLLVLPGSRQKSVLEKLAGPFQNAKRHAGNGMHNISRFMRRELHPRDGSLHLMESFYKSILENAPLPISHRDMVLTVKLMDDIFAQVYGAKHADLVQV